MLSEKLRHESVYVSGREVQCVALSMLLALAVSHAELGYPAQSTKLSTFFKPHSSLRVPWEMSKCPPKLKTGAVSWESI